MHSPKYQTRGTSVGPYCLRLLPSKRFHPTVYTYTYTTVETHSYLTTQPTSL
jgi:hypothetical protein